MRQRLAAFGLLLAASLAWLMLWGSPVVGQPPSGALQPFGAVRIVGRHNQVANVNHTGQLAVEATVNATVTTDNVNVFHQSTIRHISSATHVVGAVSLVSQLGAYVTLTGTALDVNCTGCAAASVVNVGHVSAVTHVALVGWPQWFHLGNLGHLTSVTHTATMVRGFGRQNTDVIGPTALAHAALRVMVVNPRMPTNNAMGQLQRHVGALHITTGSHILNGRDGKRIYVYAYAFQARVDGMRVQLTDSHVAHVTLLWKFNAREGTAAQAVSPPSYLFHVSAGNALTAHVMATTPTFSGNYTIDYDISWFEDD